jgi:phosphatidate cytidylyltransferase
MDVRGSMAIAGSDCFQYFAGKLFGRTKIVPRISPNKSLEGYLAGVGGCMAIYWVWLADDRALGREAGAVYVLGMLVAGILGDLFISWWKRNHHLKDTSSLLLAHGGFLDRSGPVPPHALRVCV